MSLNFSRVKCQNNLTFAELNHLINVWISEVQEIQKVFELQSDEVNKFTFWITNTQEKLEGLYKKLNLAKCWQDNIDQTLNLVTSSQQEIEQMVEELEKSVTSTFKNPVPVDIFRQNTYKVAESLDSSFCNFKGVIEEIEIRTGELNDIYLQDNHIEQFAQLLQCYLQQLESIEMKLNETKNHINKIEYIKKRVLSSLRMKENKV